MGKEFDRICKDIKSIKIQGARNIAKAALRAYKLNKTKSAKKKLLSLRPTEPMLANVLNRLDKEPYEKIIGHFDSAQEKINKKVFKLIKNGDVIFTHCHSTNVTNALIYAKKKGKKFEVYNTETRPLYQGRKTARQLKNAKIKVTMFPDSALGIALTKEQGTKRANKVFIGADALLKEGVINKVGSETVARIAKEEKIPVYVITDSWKFSPNKLELEQRSFKEVWKKAPKGIKIKNPSFEFVPKKLIKKVITEK
jgi:translation initiation factor 2B subunit (eIF-2B alpha/beta/delta family)|tara:strand:+ start:9170 stop:9931 length:762 start_codon:yes stop_codon:yes gene_type:complete